MYTYIYQCMYVSSMLFCSAQGFIDQYLSIYLSISMYACMYVCMFVCLCLCVCVCVCMFIYVFMYLCMNAYMYASVYAQGSAAEDIFSAYVYYAMPEETYQAATSCIKSAAFLSHLLSGFSYLYSHTNA